jgi:hypothetical protein
MTLIAWMASPFFELALARDVSMALPAFIVTADHGVV